MRRSDGLALGLGVLAAIVATLAGIVHTLDDKILHADVVADQAVQTLTVPTVLNTMNGPTEVKVRDAFVAVVKARPENSFVRTRRALVASAADPATQEAVRRKMLEQHAALLAGRTPAELIFDTTPRRAPFVAAYGPEEEYRAILTEHLNLAPTIRFAHGGWVDAASLTMRVADALAPYFEVLLGVLVALLVGTVLARRAPQQRPAPGRDRAARVRLRAVSAVRWAGGDLLPLDAQRGGRGGGPAVPGHGAVVVGLRRGHRPGRRRAGGRLARAAPVAAHRTARSVPDRVKPARTTHSWPDRRVPNRPSRRSSGATSHESRTTVCQSGPNPARNTPSVSDFAPRAKSDIVRRAVSVLAPRAKSDIVRRTVSVLAPRAKSDIVRRTVSVLAPPANSDSVRAAGG